MSILDIKISIADYFRIKKQQKLYKQMKHVGKNVYICEGHQISACNKLEIGNHVWIGRHCMIAAQGGVSIKSGTIISHNVEIWSQNHKYINRCTCNI